MELLLSQLLFYMLFEYSCLIVLFSAYVELTMSLSITPSLLNVL